MNNHHILIRECCSIQVRYMSVYMNVFVKEEREMTRLTKTMY